MGPFVDPVVTAEILPLRTEVVVIGAGIIGVSTALCLAEAGIPVVLCEKGQVAGEQSSRNWGWVRKQGRDPRELPLIIESLRLWAGMNKRIGAETGFCTSGILYLASNDREYAEHEAWLEHARPYQLDSRMIDGVEVARLLPGAAVQFKGALYTKSDARAEPQIAGPAMARAAAAAGAVILQQCTVRGVETQAGKVSAVVTERGRIGCASVVLAGGAWSRLFCGNLDIFLPQLKVRSSVLRTAPVSGAPEAAASSADFAFRKRLDGGYTIANGWISQPEITPASFRLLHKFLPSLWSERAYLRPHLSRQFFKEAATPRHWKLTAPSPFEAERTLDPAPNMRLNNIAMCRLAECFPAFAGAEILQHWAGFIDVTPDSVPVISPVETLPGFFIATGFSGHGFGIGPAAGRLMADLVTGAPPVVDPAPFRLSRFA
jgi:glycine/D-amino acid oxidase-like deaminating enzyme